VLKSAHEYKLWTLVR